MGAIHEEPSVVAVRVRGVHVVAAVICLARLQVFGLKSIGGVTVGGSRPSVRATSVPLLEGSLVEG